MKVILLSGKSKSGKSTISDMILDNKSASVEIAFGDALKELLSETYDLPLYLFQEQRYKELPIPSLPFENINHKFIGKDVYEKIQEALYYDTDEDQYYWTPRALMLFEGTHVKRAVNPNYWIDKVLNHLEILKVEGLTELVIISDARFIEEVTAVKAKWPEALLVRAERKLSSSLKHTSEIDLDNYTEVDYVITNNGSLRELEQKTLNMLEEIEK